MAPETTILMHDMRWKGLRPTVQRAATAALEDQAVRDATLTILLADDAEVQSLNGTYRGKATPTNVLSFPDGSCDSGKLHLGDIILSYDTIAQEAVVQKKKLKAHLSHLVIHGVLHLLGFDHAQERDANRMESREIYILARMGIANPYETA